MIWPESTEHKRYALIVVPNYLFTIFFLTLAIFVLLFRLDSALIESSLSVFFWPFVYALDLVSYLWLCLALLLYTLSNKLQVSSSDYFCSTLTSNIHFTQPYSSANKLPGTSKLPSALSSNTIDVKWINLFYSLYKARLYADHATTFTSSDHARPSQTYLSMYLDLSNSSEINTLNVPSTYSYLSSANGKLSDLLDSKVFTTPLNLSTLGKASSYLNETYSSSISQNLSLANQTRWALKMSPISEKLVRDNFNYTQAKSLLGSPIVNSLTSSNNIWSSNNLTNLKDASNFMIAPGTTNLNYFEDSRSWVMKKAYFSLGTSFYTLSADSSPLARNSNNLNSSSILSAYLLDYNLSRSNFSLSSSDPYVESNPAKPLLTFVTSDSTVYQDSYNNFIFTLSGTTTEGTLNNFRHRESVARDFVSVIN